MSKGREHAERRASQAAAARRWKLRDKNDFDWKKAEGMK